MLRKYYKMGNKKAYDITKQLVEIAQSKYHALDIIVRNAIDTVDDGGSVLYKGNAYNKDELIFLFVTYSGPFRHLSDQGLRLTYNHFSEIILSACPDDYHRENGITDCGAVNILVDRFCLQRRNVHEFTNKARRWFFYYEVMRYKENVSGNLSVLISADSGLSEKFCEKMIALYNKDKKFFIDGVLENAFKSYEQATDTLPKKTKKRKPRKKKSDLEKCLDMCNKFVSAFYKLPLEEQLQFFHELSDDVRSIFSRKFQYKRR